MTPLLLLQHALRQKAASQLPAAERIARRLEPQLRKQFLDAVRKSKEIIDLHELELLILSGNSSVIEHFAGIDEWDTVYSEMKPTMRSAFIEGSLLSALLVGITIHDSTIGTPATNEPLAPIRPPDIPSGQIGMRLDLINHHAVNYADKKFPKIVASYKEDAKANIKQIVTDSVSGKYTVQQAAKLIRGEIGLTKQYKRAVDAKRELFISQGLAGEKLEKKVQAYTDKLIRARAKTIARTEILQAQAAGQRALWNEAANNGVFDRHTAKRQWVTHEDERACKLCITMDGQEIPFNGSYTHPTLGSLNSFGDPIQPSEMHPNCRCSENLIL